MFDSSCQHHAVEAFVVMHAPCNRLNRVRLPAGAPKEPEPGEASTQRSYIHDRVAHWSRALASEARGSGFESCRDHQLRSVALSGGESVLKTVPWR